MKYTILLLLFFFDVICCFSVAPEWQWSIQLPSFVSTETNDHPRAFLWIPHKCKQVKAVVVANHNMIEEGILEHPMFREEMADLNVALVWISPGLGVAWTGDDMSDLYQSVFDGLAEISGYSELSYAPVVPMGHSAYATFPWNFAAWCPEKTLAIISLKGDAPQTSLTGYGRANANWESRNIDGIPGLMVMGEDEWWEDRLNPVATFNKKYPNACVSVLADVSRGHFDFSDDLVLYLALFIEKSITYRVSSTFEKDRKLITINPRKGYLAERWFPHVHHYRKITKWKIEHFEQGNYYWCFDKDMAKKTIRYYNSHYGRQKQYIGFSQQESVLDFNEKSPVGYQLKFLPHSDGLSFNVKAVVVDSTRRMKVATPIQPRIERICGPVAKINDSLFRVQFYRMGLTNTRRTGDIWLYARADGDKYFRGAVQQANMRIPIAHTIGDEQEIQFDSICNIKCSDRKINLKAKSTSNLPVHFFVVEGPAIIEDDQLILLPLPPKTKYPVKVTVTAWQYGSNELKIRTAEPITRSFYISRD